MKSTSIVSLQDSESIFTSGPNAVYTRMPYFSFVWLYSFWFECTKLCRKEEAIIVMK